MTKFTSLAILLAMRDLYKIHADSKSTMTFNNFFKSMSFKTAKQMLEEKGFADKEIVYRVPPAPARPAQVFAHDLIALIFIQWLDEARYMRMLDKMLYQLNPAGHPVPKSENREHTEHATHG